jgi:ribosomal protein L34E
MTKKVYAVYSIPRSPEYHLEALFDSKDAAKAYVNQKKVSRNFTGTFCKACNQQKIYDIQLEEIK